MTKVRATRLEPPAAQVLAVRLRPTDSQRSMRWSAGLLTAVERVLPLASLTGWRMLVLLVKPLRRLLAELLRSGAASRKPLAATASRLCLACVTYLGRLHVWPPMHVRRLHL